MQDKIIDGKVLQAELFAELRMRIHVLKQRGIIPSLVTIIVGDDAASLVYIKNKQKSCEMLGLKGIELSLPTETTTGQLIEAIEKYNNDPSVHGILVQLPLPPHIDELQVLQAVNPKKDVDGFNPVNVGLLSINAPYFTPATPLGCMRILEKVNQKADITLTGKHAVIIGSSNIVGKPLAMALTNAGATVTLCNIHTQDLRLHTRSADILVVAIGKPQFIDGTYVKEGATILDVGINRLEDGKIVGDVDFEKAFSKCRCITPVPGGVGPMTIAALMENTVKSAESK